MVDSLLSPATDVNSPISVQLSLLNKSDGSASVRSSSGARVVTSVNGPIEVRIRDEVLGEATLELKVLPPYGLAGTQERYIERLIRNSIKSCLLLGLHPRSLIQVTSQVISMEPESLDSLEIIATTINSIVLGAIDAGVSMNAMLAAAVVQMPNGSRHVASYSFPKRQLIMVESIGPFTRLELADAMEKVLERCEEVFEVMKSQIEEKVKKDNRWRDE